MLGHLTVKSENLKLYKRLRFSDLKKSYLLFEVKSF